MAKKYAPNQIRRLRTERGWTLEELAARMEPETTHATVGRLETSQMGLTLDYINSFADAFGITPAEVILSAASGVRIAPILGTIAAGNWQEAVALADEFMGIPESAGGQRTFLLRPVGDSMDKLVGEDGLIAVDPDQIDLVDEKCYCLMNGDYETTFKRFRVSPPQLEPCSNNPSHVPIPLGREPFTVIGRVTMAFNPV